MSGIPEDVIYRLRAFAAEPPERADEIHDALEYVRAVCPDFAFAGEGTRRRATLTLRDGVTKELAGTGEGDLLAQAASLITGRGIGQHE
jgi:hypothetical protein